MKILVVSSNQFSMLYVKCGVPQRYVVGTILFFTYIIDHSNDLCWWCSVV